MRSVMGGSGQLHRNWRRPGANQKIMTGQWCMKADDRGPCRQWYRRCLVLRATWTIQVVQVAVRLNSTAKIQARQVPVLPKQRLTKERYGKSKCLRIWQNRKQCYFAIWLVGDVSKVFWFPRKDGGFKLQNKFGDRMTAGFESHK